MHHVDCQAALDPALAYAERAEAAGTPSNELLDIAVAHQNQGIVGGKEAEQGFLALALAAEEVGWAPDEVTGALVALAVARCQTAVGHHGHAYHDQAGLAAQAALTWSLRISARLKPVDQRPVKPWKLRHLVPAGKRRRSQIVIAWCALRPRCVTICSGVAMFRSTTSRHGARADARRAG